MASEPASSALHRWLALPAAVARFLRDPLGAPVEGEQALAPLEVPAAELASIHLPFALKAQGLALRDRHADAILAMEEARRELVKWDGWPYSMAPSQRPEEPVDALHRRTLVALADAFIVQERLKQQDPSAWTPSQCRQADQTLAAALQARPDLPYLHRVRAQLCARLGRLDDALEALDRAEALGPPGDGVGDALSAASWLLAGSLDGRLEDLRRVERRFFDGPRREQAVAASRDPGHALFWRARLVLAQAEASASGAAEAKRAAGLFRRAERELDGDEAEAAATWLDRAWRATQAPGGAPLDLPLVIRRLKRNGADAAAQALGGDGRLPSWHAVAQAIERCPQPAAARPVDPVRLLEPVVRARRGLEPQRTRPPTQRIVLSLSSNLIPDESSFATITRDAGDEAPTTARLRTELRKRHGIELPGLLLRQIESGDAPGDPAAAMAILSISLDGVPLGTDYLPAGDGRLRLVPRGTSMAADGLAKMPLHWFDQEAWLDKRARDATLPGSFDPGLVANLFALQHVLRRLDELVGPQDLLRLELADLNPRPVLAMLCILAACRAPLEAGPALRDLAGRAATGAESPQSAAQAYRELPDIRPRLWGRDGTFAARRLDDELASALEAAVPRRPGGAASLPRSLVDRLHAWARARLDEERCCVVVQAGALRAWVRALLRPQWPDVPVLADSEGLLP